MNAISDRVRTCKWDEPVPSGTPGRPGGYVWHTTGSGKTMTSFKAAQLIAGSKDADKVVFLMDRVELGTQSLLEYRSFADDADDVQGTENTDVLKSKLAKHRPQRHSDCHLHPEDEQHESGRGAYHPRWNWINLLHNASSSLWTNAIVPPSARCCRIFAIPSRTRCISVSQALPFMGENHKKSATTAMVFGRCLHRYSIADGIRDAIMCSDSTRTWC